MAAGDRRLSDDVLVEGALRAVARHGWRDTTLERIAQECGVSRVTLHRHGISREAVFRLFVARYERAYRDAMWPVLTAQGDGRTRLALALAAICDVEEEQLDLMGALDEDANARLFHEEPSEEALSRAEFTGPLVRLLEDGMADGSIRPVDPDETATVLMNVVGRTYRHLRVHHRWGIERSRATVLALLERGWASGG
ncbi:MAG: TetR/AcrR family transcriptional regulator [Thermoleophilia bacterium]